jgi:hypothetical protein
VGLQGLIIHIRWYKFWAISIQPRLCIARPGLYYPYEVSVYKFPAARVNSNAA